MGLLKPKNGSIFIDDVELSQETTGNWQSKISHVPQKIFLSNTTFLENIAFGVEFDKIDKDRVITSTEALKLKEFII